MCAIWSLCAQSQNDPSQVSGVTPLISVAEPDSGREVAFTHIHTNYYNIYHSLYSNTNVHMHTNLQWTKQCLEKI